MVLCELREPAPYQGPGVALGTCGQGAPQLPPCWKKQPHGPLAAMGLWLPHSPCATPQPLCHPTAHGVEAGTLYGWRSEAHPDGATLSPPVLTCTQARPAP